MCSSTALYGAGSAAAVALAKRLGCAGPALPGHGCCRWGGIKLRHGRRVRVHCVSVADRGLPPNTGRCSIACQARQAAGGQSTVVASVQLFSAHVDGGRARHPSHTWSSIAASDMTLVFATAVASDARCQRGSEAACGPHASSDVLTFFVRFDSQTSRRLPHILWKLLRRRMR